MKVCIASNRVKLDINSIRQFGLILNKIKMAVCISHLSLQDKTYSDLGNYAIYGESAYFASREDTGLPMIWRRASLKKLIHCIPLAKSDETCAQFKIVSNTVRIVTSTWPKSNTVRGSESESHTRGNDKQGYRDHTDADYHLTLEI